MRQKPNSRQQASHGTPANPHASHRPATTLTLEDFQRTGNLWLSKDGTYALSRDEGGYMYPFHKTDGRLVHTSYDYSFTPETCLRILNMVLAGTWRHGCGTFINFTCT